jgi:hypothetical protein
MNPRSNALSEHFIIGYFGELGQMALQSDFERPIPVYRDRQPHDAARFPVDMMAAIHTQQSPATPLDEASEVAADSAFIQRFQ